MDTKGKRTRVGATGFGGGGTVAACAAAADPAMNVGWFVLMYAVWISIRLCAYSDVGPRRSRRSSDTHSTSCACSRGKCSSSYNFEVNARIESQRYSMGETVMLSHRACAVMAYFHQFFVHELDTTKTRCFQEFYLRLDQQIKGRFGDE